MGDFKLSAQLLGHEADVRAVSYPSTDTVITASRDCSVRIWRRSQTTPPVFDGTLLSKGSEYVNSVTFVPPSEHNPDGLVISGGKDTIIEAKSPKSAPTDHADRLLIGHAHNVCTLDVSPQGKYLVSGGWDGQARVWNLSTWETEFTLGGHEGMSVWAVVALNETTVVTGCADKSIRFFDLTKASASEVMPTSTIQTPEVVRALCVLHNHPSGASIASASNDGTIRLWKLNGQQVAELHGHESFVYSLAALPTGEIVSSGEDRTVRVWKGQTCIQTITHPAISVWTVGVNAETGNIVTGASDGVARIFSRHPDQIADKETVKEFEDAVKGSAIPQQQVGGINKEKLPGPEFLQSKSGTKDGQVQMIKEDNGNITAHTWSMSQQQWINVGTVVDAVGSTGKKVEYQGKSYDYVFDVDIEDGKPALKLPYNLSENPYERATKFLNDNELPLTYLDNVANFITQNTQGASLGQQSGAGGADPLGTESRYRPGEETAAQQPKVLPQTEYLSISAAKLDAIFNKLSTVNKALLDAGHKDLSLNPGQENSLAALKASLESSSAVTSDSIASVARIVSVWPYKDRLAGLDALRCVARYHTAAKFTDSQGRSLLDIAIQSSFADGEAPNENAVMMGARTIANLFGSADGRSLVSSNVDKILAFLERALGISGGDAIGQFNRNVLIAITTSAINLAVLVHKEKLLSPDQRRRLLLALGKVLRDQTDSEILYRALVATGTILKASKAEGATIEGLYGMIDGAAKKSTEERVAGVADECKALVA